MFFQDEYRTQEDTNAPLDGQSSTKRWRRRPFARQRGICLLSRQRVSPTHSPSVEVPTTVRRTTHGGNRSAGVLEERCKYQLSPVPEPTVPKMALRCARSWYRKRVSDHTIREHASTKIISRSSHHVFSLTARYRLIRLWSCYDVGQALR